MLAFGPRAARWAAAMPADLPVIAVDEFGAAAAYRAAVEHRSNARPFFVWVCVPPNRAAMALQVAAKVREGKSYDEQRVLFEELTSGAMLLNGARVDSLSIGATETVRWQITEILRLADGLFATSQTEATRIRDFYAVTKTAVAVAAATRSGLPSFTRSGRGERIVVWANGMPIEHCELIAHSLGEMRLPLVVVADNLEVFAKPGTPVPADLGALLATASVIVDASIGDPSEALALAAGGVPLAVARTSGAHEYLTGATSYDPWSWRSIYNAVSAALGEGAPVLADLAPPLAAARAVIARASAPAPVDGPLVSVIIPTYNRRERLPAALSSIFLQQYRNLEVIVVNDGGAAVDDVVAAFPAARLISYEQNGGVEHAINTGYAAATGAYVTHVSDDDAFYPDHIARLVQACETTGCAIAHGNTMIRFLRDVAGGMELEGFACNVFAFPLEKTEAMSNSPVAGHSFIIRRDVGETLGWYDETLPVLGDQEMQTRYAKAFDFVHVDRVTTEWRFTGGDANLSSRKAAAVPDAMRQWFASHPSDRPLVTAYRNSALSSIDNREAGFRFLPTVSYPPGIPPF